MHAGAIAFALLALNPFGGLLIALPFAVFQLHWPVWLAWVVGSPLGYVQVLVVDLFWSQLTRLRWWNAFLERRRNARVEKLVASRGSFWLTVMVSPMIGPWIVMAFMRYANVPLRKVALPLALGIFWTGGAIAIACAWLPQLVRR